MYFYGLPRKSCKEFNIEKIRKIKYIFGNDFFLNNS